jgi:fatty-acyl-CoA synthase
LATMGLSGISIDEFGAQAAASEPLADAMPDPDRPSLILYTSGTSGKPKGVLLTERNLEQTAINFALLGRVTADSVFLCDAPMFHVLGLVTNIRPTLMQGGALVISDGFVPARTLARLTDPALGITHYFCVPQMASALRAEPAFAPERLRHLTAIFTGGAPHPAADIRAWLKDGIAVVDGFGMSEAGTVFGMPLDPTLIAARAGSAGVAAPGIRARIVDASGRLCPPGEAGELLLKGENLTSGYWRKPEETVAAFTEDGWFKTGDIARADEEGYQWIVDRRKDMFISGGENVYPAEIESVLAQFPGLSECAMVGVPDERWGEAGHLFLVSQADAQIDLDSVRDHLGRHVARYKIPKHISVLECLPRNGAGKILKNVLRQTHRSEGT